MAEHWKEFYNAETGEILASYTIRGTFEGEEAATIELLAGERGIDPADIKTRIVRRKRAQV